VIFGRGRRIERDGNSLRFLNQHGLEMRSSIEIPAITTEPLHAEEPWSGIIWSTRRIDLGATVSAACAACDHS
jgi:hypothetical protein